MLMQRMPRLKEKTGVAFEVVMHEDSDIHVSKKKIPVYDGAEA